MSQPIHIRQTKYGPEQARWIVINLGKVSKPEMAKKFGVSAEAFRRVLSWLRAKGYNIPREYSSQAQPKSLGEVVCRKYNNRPDRYFRKTKTGWKECTREFRKVRLFKSEKPPVMPKEKTTKTDARTQKSGSAQRKHMDGKPPVEGAHFKKPEKVFKTRKVVDGPIVIVLNDKAKTRLTARDEEHAAAIRLKYAYLEKGLEARF